MQLLSQAEKEHMAATREATGPITLSDVISFIERPNIPPKKKWPSTLICPSYDRNGDKQVVARQAIPALSNFDIVYRRIVDKPQNQDEHHPESPFCSPFWVRCLLWLMEMRICSTQCTMSLTSSKREILRFSTHWRSRHYTPLHREPGSYWRCLRYVWLYQHRRAANAKYGRRKEP